MPNPRGSRRPPSLARKDKPVCRFTRGQVEEAARIYRLAGYEPISSQLKDFLDQHPLAREFNQSVLTWSQISQLKHALYLAAYMVEHDGRLPREAIIG